MACFEKQAPGAGRGHGAAKTRMNQRRVIRPNAMAFSLHPRFW
jgi:hypothetical protein